MTEFRFKNSFFGCQINLLHAKLAKTLEINNDLKSEPQEKHSKVPLATLKEQLQFSLDFEGYMQ